MSDVTRHYTEYKQTLGKDTYSMKSVGDTSRIRFLYQWIKKYVPEGQKILDVGCGDMHLATLLPEYEWTGIDLLPQLSADKAVAHDLMKQPYPFEDGVFAAAVCSEVLEHVWDPLIIHREVKRVLKAQGTYIISTPNYDHADYLLSHYRALLFDPRYMHSYEHIRQYNLAVHQELLTATGFDVVEHTGADAQYSAFFREAREVLVDVLKGQFDVQIDAHGADQILGLMFKNHSHTIMAVCKPRSA